MGCAAGLTQHRHSCIMLESTPATFSSAKTACSASGSLLKIDFMVELSEIVTALSGKAADVHFHSFALSLLKWQHLSFKFFK